MVVNNSTNINKENKHFLPRTIEHLKDHHIWRWKSGFSLGLAQKCVWVKPVNGILILDNWIANDYTDINKQ